jgi:hypothetical protein
MRLTVNGMNVPWPAEGLDVVIDVDSTGETSGSVKVMVRGGHLHVLAKHNSGGAALTVTAKDGGTLVFGGDPPVVLATSSLGRE